MKRLFSLILFLNIFILGRLFAQSFPVDTCLGGSNIESLVSALDFEAYGTQYFNPYIKSDSVWRYCLLNSASADGFFTGKDTGNFEPEGYGNWLVRVNMYDHRIEKIFAGNSTLINYKKGFLFFETLDDRYIRTVWVDDSFRLKNIALLDSFVKCFTAGPICTELSSGNAMSDGDSLIHIYVLAKEYVPSNPPWQKVFRYTLTADGAYRGKQQSPTYFHYKCAGVYEQTYWHISNNAVFFYDNRDSLVKTLQADTVTGSPKEVCRTMDDMLFWFRSPATLPLGIPMDIYRINLNDLGYTHSRVYTRNAGTYLELLSGWTQFLDAGILAVAESDSAYFYRLPPAGDPELIFSRRLGLNVYSYTGAQPYQDSLRIFLFRGAENSFFHLSSPYGKVHWTASLPQFLTSASGLLKNPRSERFTRTRFLNRYYAIASYADELGNLDAYPALFRFNPANRQSTVVALGENGERFLDVFDDALGNVYLLAYRSDGECYPGSADVLLYKLTGVPTAVFPEPLAEHGFRVYPNPAQKQLFIELDERNGEMVRLRLFDIGGKLISVQSTNTDLSVIDVQDLTAGEYVIQAEMDKGISSAKVIIAR